MFKRFLITFLIFILLLAQGFGIKAVRADSEELVSPTPAAEAVTTGDAVSSGTIITTGNDNIVSADSPTPTATPTPAVVENIGNGAGSSNNASQDSAQNQSTTQTNTADTASTLDLAATTGQNTSSLNTGADSSVTTGDANTSGTLITSANTNISGVSVSEYNITGTQTGDLTLNSTSNCISGCEGNATSAGNIGNGGSSTNNTNVQDTNNVQFQQSNEATAEGSLILSADSGNNQASYNTGVSSSIDTGDANISANSLTFANNNIAGDVDYMVVNIYGSLVGDIILPELAADTSATTSANNTNNGGGSVNTSNLDLSTNKDLFQSNDATIENNLNLTATTGDNETNYNTGGNSSIQTGNSTINTNTVNIANSNIEGDSWWLVIVNKAGEWLGQILGAPKGSTFAGSSNTQFNVAENGAITATNNGNGSNSENSTSVIQSSNQTTTQTNSANIKNNLNLTANTGKNTSSYNTGGDSTIKTGDATVIANLINFVNNNITGGGKLAVTVINVFGSWIGDFVAPGQKKQIPQPDPVTETVGDPISATQDNSGQGSQNSNEQSSTQSPVSSTTQEQANQNTPGAVLGTSVNNLVNIAGSILSQAPVVHIADSKISQDQKVAEQETKSDKQTLNLAWGLLVIPLALIFLVLRKIKKSLWRS